MPLNTYRLELSASFTFEDARARLDYFDDLGITHLYLSPILTAAPGSTHGYDVVDPTTVSEALGGRSGFEALADAAHARSMGVVVDVCPNHMAICDPLWANAMLWSALRDGEDSPYFGWFDIIDDGQLVIPFLPDQLPALLDAGRIGFGTLTRPGEPSERILLVDESPYPLAAGTEELPIEDALEAQRYRLVRYSGFDTPLNHRRFFDIISLIGVRQERPEVFEATHATLLDLVASGHIDGFRIDHSDGLADPEGYFERLHEASGGLWTITEKVLSADETLPEPWLVNGTSGYEAAWRFDAVQLDPDAAEPLTRLGLEQDGGEWARRFGPDDPPTPGHLGSLWENIERASRQVIATTNMAVDVERLVGLLRKLADAEAAALQGAMELPAHAAIADATGDDLRQCLRELLYALDRYRTYVRPGAGPDPSAEVVLAVAAERAAEHLPEPLLPLLDWLIRVAAYHPSAFSQPSAITDATWRSFVIRLQQLTGVVVGKGIEDTAFYRWPQLLTLCEVGADPRRFGLTPDELHDWLTELNSRWPATMTLGSTHDSKRSEDIRARLSAISEYPREWAALVDAVAPAASALPAPIRSIWRQTLAGTWTDNGPIEAERLAAFMLKAGREQRLWTTWFGPDEATEAEVSRAIPDLLADPAVRGAFDDWHALVAGSARTNTLCTKLVQLTAAGVADIYQGSETVRLNLTDPDNRRPIDWDELAELLRASEQVLGPPAPAVADRTSTEDAEAGVADGRTRVAGRGRLAAEKLFLTSTALHLRRRHPDAFTGGAYQPLLSSTDFAWGFARGEQPAAVTIATRLPRAARAARDSGAREDHLVLPKGTWRNLLTGAAHTGEFAVWQGLDGWPCALLERID